MPDSLNTRPVSTPGKVKLALRFFPMRQWGSPAITSVCWLIRPSAAGGPYEISRTPRKRLGAMM
ncbi:hypothetical protein N7462_006891 [Penicillium macrosclerotiorum]|uniref:uncharacterized protein n=1 Tax=Penicillium macrosclerotiorum TaxID=303699 RepID=UPI0025483EEC|nr:uncharacterized protein N7462_006891 [Penicillium macrosclerotiorum]KAJ5678647.1 hypothetical protein N7462_006891 [Penicillium macrosclerotiorum]